MNQSPELDGLRHWRVSVPKDRVIYDEGETPLAFYRVETGCVRLQVFLNDGRRQVLAFCLPGDVFGIEVETARAIAAEAAADCELTRFPITVISDPAMRAHNVVALTSASAALIATLSEHLKGIGHAPADGRVLWFFDWLAHRQDVKTLGGIVQLPMSRRDVADFLGMAEETLSRACARLERQQQIKVINQRKILLRPRLQRRLTGLSESALQVDGAVLPFFAHADHELPPKAVAPMADATAPIDLNRTESAE